MPEMYYRQCPDATHITYAVPPGYTLYLLTLLFSVSLESLIAANPGIDPNNIKAFQVICVPRPCRPGWFPHYVQKGDTLYSIANKYRVPLHLVIASNPQIKNPNIIFIGQKVCIPVYENA